MSSYITGRCIMGYYITNSCVISYYITSYYIITRPCVILKLLLVPRGRS